MATRYRSGVSVLNPLLSAVALALAVGVAVQRLFGSAALGALAGAAAFAAVVVARSRRLGGLAAVPIGADEAPDPAERTRASAARLGLACLTGVFLATVLSTCLAASSLLQAVSLAALAVALGLVAAGLMERVQLRSPSTLVVAGIVVMLVGQLVGSGNDALTRRAVAVGLIALAWGVASAGAVMLRPAGGGTTVALVGATTAVIDGWLVHAGNYAAAMLLPVVLLAPAMISAIWAEVISLAGDRYLGDDKRRRRRR